MKKYTLFSLVACALIFSGGSIVLAQDSGSSGSSSLQSDPLLFIKNITLDEPTFSEGENVTGSFEIYTSPSVSVPDAYYTVSLVGEYQENTLAAAFFDTKSYGPVFIGLSGSQKVDFSYQLPEGVAGEGLGIQIQARLKSGSPMGWSDARISVSGENLPRVAIDKVQVLVDGKEFGPQEGPTVSAGSFARLEVSMSNPTDQTLTLSPTMEIFDRTEIGTPLTSLTEGAIVLQPGTEETVTYELPLFAYTPKVYAGVLEFIDEDGVARSSAVHFRYIVGGDIATITSVLIDKQRAERGDVVTLTVILLGTPMDIGAVSVASVGEVTVRAKLFDENGKQIGTAETTAVPDQEPMSVALAVSVDGPANAMSSIVEVEKDGKILTSTETNFNGRENGF
jgi:hypothetical protein